MAIDPVYDPKATSVPVLRYLVALAEHRHFGRAATACRVSQPTLSALVSRWERRMRLRVFDRGPGGVRLTAAGERVVAAARVALESLRTVEDAAVEAKPPFFGPVRLGVIPTVAPYILPFATRAVERAFPDLELPVREATTGELLADLDAGRVDLALLAILPGMAERHHAVPFYDEPFLVALPRHHRLAGQELVAVEDRVGERLLLLAEGHCLRDQALAVCGRIADQQAGADYRATSLETLRQLVAMGAGVTLLPALAAPGEDDRRLIVRPLREPVHRTIGLLWRRTDPRHDGYGQLTAAVRRAVPFDVLRRPGTTAP